MFSELEKTRTRDVDLAARARMVRAFLGAVPGAVLGLIGGFRLMAYSESALAPLYPVIGLLIGALFVFGFVMLVSGAGGKVGSALYNPSGKTTPHKAEYSQAQSLVVRGMYTEAVDAYELLVSEHPKDSEPYIQLARLYRDRLDDMEGAVRWFRRALNESQIASGQEILVGREISEIYMHRMGQPERAAPFLARIAEKYPDTPDGQWAERELQELIRLKSDRLEE
jgi:tetratricopeptide (TPR) repeat protein